MYEALSKVDQIGRMLDKVVHSPNCWDLMDQLYKVYTLKERMAGTMPSNPLDCNHIGHRLDHLYIYIDHCNTVKWNLSIYRAHE